MSTLKGVITAIPTPLKENEDVNTETLKKLIDHVINEGADGIFVIGNMGEGPALTDSQKELVVKTGSQHIAGRVPFLAGIAEVSTRRAIELGKRLQQYNPDYLVATTPYYYKFPSGDSIIKSITSLCENLSKPIVFYNCPGATGNSVSLDTLENILTLPNVAGIKDSSGNVPVFMELLRRYPERQGRKFSIMQGDESLYDISLLLGADGVVTGGGTAFIKLLKKLYKSATENDKMSAFNLQREFRTKMDQMLGPDLLIDWMAAIKGRLKEQGVCDDVVTSPFLKRKIDNN